MQSFRRSIFLIDKKFQLRFSFYVCIWVFALSLLCPLIVGNMFGLMVRYASSVPGHPGLDSLQKLQGRVLGLLILLQLAFLGATFLISIFISHRIAGPLHKLKKYLAAAGEGRLGQPLKFRGKDHFQDVAASFNAMSATLRDRHLKREQATESARSRIEKTLPLIADPEGRRQLEQAIAELRQM